MNCSYPCIEIDLGKLRENTSVITELCARAGVYVAGVVKATDGDLACTRAMADSGCAQIASSRLRHLKDLREAGVDKPLMLVRIPMLSELGLLAQVCDISLHSEAAVLRALDREMASRGQTHGVILMIELGDLREGVWGDSEVVSAALEVEKELHNLHLLGVGTNLGCFGAIEPTKEKLEEFVAKAELVENAIGRRLEVISGGGSTSLPRILDGDMPARINHLRIGEAILLNDLGELYGYEIPGTHRDVFTLWAEIVEAGVKPSHPIGEIAFDAYRGKPAYADLGDRRRALLAAGKADYAYPDQLIPRDEGVAVLGASSDHTILDIEDASADYKAGDILAFDFYYGALALSMGARDVTRKYIDTSFAGE
jgi:predicted amino acid racemase